jgi:hypothetical protein
MRQAATAAQAARQIDKQSTVPPDARAYLSIIDCPAFLQAVADGNAGAVEEFHNDGVGKLNKVLSSSCMGRLPSTLRVSVRKHFSSTATRFLPHHTFH